MSQSLSRGKPLEPGDYGFRVEDLPSLGDSPEQSRFDFRTWFAPEHRDRPMELEIGSGKGTFLVQQAPLTPDVNYVGIEYASAFWLYAADRVRRHAMDNVRMLCADAKTIIGWYMPDAAVRAVHVYFPDPWPKTRHHKRRMIQLDTLAHFHRILEPGGQLRLVTDHADYFAWMEDHAAQVTDRFDRIAFERPDSTDTADAGEVVGTNFERKYRREGRPFNAMTLVKK